MSKDVKTGMGEKKGEEKERCSKGNDDYSTVDK